MARTINFVRERQRNLSHQEQEDRKILKYVTFGMFGLGAVILVIVAARLFLLFQIKSIQSEQKSVEQEIVAMEEIEEQYTIFSNKLKILTELFGKRKEKQEALAYFSGLFGPDVIVSQLSYKGGEEVLSFVLQSTSVFTMEDVFKIMSSDEVKERYPNIQRNSLRRSSDGSYGMQITLVFGEEASQEIPPADGSEILEDVEPTTTDEVPVEQSESEL